MYRSYFGAFACLVDLVFLNPNRDWLASTTNRNTLSLSALGPLFPSFCFSLPGARSVLGLGAVALRQI